MWGVLGSNGKDATSSRESPGGGGIFMVGGRQSGPTGARSLCWLRTIAGGQDVPHSKSQRLSQESATIPGKRLFLSNYSTYKKYPEIINDDRQSNSI